MIDSAFRMGNNYYPQVFLEECYFRKFLEISSDSDRENSDEEILMKKTEKKFYNFFFYIYKKW